MKRREKGSSRRRRIQEERYEKPYYPRCAYTGKVSFPSPEASEVSQRIMEEKHGSVGLLPFKCDYCGQYHLGHPKERSENYAKKEERKA